MTDGIAHDVEVPIGIKSLARVEEGTSEVFDEELGAGTCSAMEENDGVVGSIGIYLQLPEGLIAGDEGVDNLARVESEAFDIENSARWLWP